MASIPILPLRIRGILDFFRFHPFWSSKYRNDFGSSIVILSVALPLIFFWRFVVPMGKETWPLFGFTAFVFGSAAALVICSEVGIFVRSIQGATRGCGTLLVAQTIGAGLIAVSYYLSRSPKSFSSIANGAALYPFFFGALVIVAAPIAIWESTRKGDMVVPNQSSDPASSSGTPRARHEPRLR